MANERIGIDFQANGLSELLKNAKDLESVLRALKAAKVNHLFDLSADLNQIRQLQQTLHTLETARKSAANAGLNTSALDSQINTVNKKINEIRQNASNISLDIRSDNAQIQATNLVLRDTKTQAEEAAQAIRDMGSALESVGGVFNTLGNISGAIGDFSAGIANSFSSMGQLFNNASVTDTLTRLATLGITQSFAGNLDSAMTRYDILNTFTPYMNAAGVDTATADRALQRVNDAILGVPIGLDEAAQRLRRYQMFLGDTEAATNLTIGIQNAILAGGASEQMKNQAYLQIDRLLSAGKLNTSRQWLSLIQGLGVSMTYVNEQMGTAGMTVNEFVAGLTSGEISTKQFLDALMELGKGESSAAQGLKGLVDIYKSTLQAWRSNIEFAATRGQANIFGALEETLSTYTGKGNTDYMKIYRDFMNNTYKGVANYIKDNPLITVNALNNFERLLAGIEKFSASTFATEVFNRLGQGVDILNAALEKIPAGKLEEFAAFATTLAGPIGAALAGSSGLGQLLGIFERFKNFDFSGLVDKIATQIERMARVIETMLNMIPDNMLGDLMAFGLVWGKPLASVLTSIGGALNTVGATLKNISGAASLSGAFMDGGILGWLIKLGQMHPMLTAAAAAIAAIGVAGTALRGLAEAKGRSTMEALGLGNVDQDIANAERLIESINRTKEARKQSIVEVNQQIQEAEELRQHILDLNSQDLDDSGFAELELSVDRLNAIMPGLGVELDGVTGHLTAQSAAALEDASAFQQLAAEMEAAAYKSGYAEIKAQEAQLKIQKEILEQDKKKAQETLDVYGEDGEYGKLLKKAQAQNGYLSGEDEKRWNELSKKGISIAATQKEAREAYDEASEGLEENEKALNDNARELALWEAEYEKASAKAKQFTEGTKENTEALKDMAEAAQEVAKSGLAQTMGELSQNAPETFKGFEEWDSPKPWYDGGGGVLTKDTKNMEKEANFLNTAADDLESVRGYFEKWNELEFPEGVDSANLKTNLMAYLDEMLGTDDPEVAAQKIHNILAAFEEGDMDTLINLAGNKGATTEALERYQEETGNWKEYLEETQNNVDEAGEIAKKIPEGMEKVKEAIAEIRKTLHFDGEGEGEGSIFEGEGGAFTNSVHNMVDRIESMRSSIKSAAESFLGVTSELQEQASSTAEYASSITESLQQVQESTATASSEVPASATTMATGLNEQLESAASTAESCAQRIIDAVNTIAPAIQVAAAVVTIAAASLASGLSSGMNAAASAAQSAASAISSAAASIQSAVAGAAAAAASLSTISVPSTSSGTSNGSVNGGNVVVEAATGGGVFRRIGTDTQPYMLTPGEWVMRKGAVDYFGSTLFDRINALDIDGVYNSLIKTLPGIRGGNIYNTRDNHAKVTQNIITNNPNYPMRRAWRFANAL